MLNDLRFALRTLRRRPGFTMLAVATIALGIGAATSIYSVVDGVLFRPLPFREPGRIVAIWQTFPRWRSEPILASMWDHISLSIPELRDLRAQQSMFTDVGAWSGSAALLTSAEAPEQVRVTRASPSLLPVLGVQPMLGRNFLPGEDTPVGARVTMLSYESWQARFAGDPRVLGKSVRFDDVPYTIIGVLPPGLTLGRAGTPAPFWVPIGQDSNDFARRDNHSYFAIGRLKPGVSRERAQPEVDRILRGTTEPSVKGVHLLDWQRDQTRDARAPLIILFAAVGLLLLVACVNVATLMLGEAAGREHEMAARMALGAASGRVIRQLLTESVTLATAGAALGSLLAWWGTKALVALAPPGIPGLSAVRMDLRVLCFALIAAVATGVLFGLAPAVTLARSRPGLLLRAGTGQSARGRGPLQRLLVAFELAVSVVLLIGAGLLARSLDKVTAVSPGFRTDHLLVVRPSYPRSVALDSVARRAFHAHLAERLTALPGVTAVAGSSNPPFAGGWSSASIEVEGRPLPPGAQLPEVQQRTVLPNFFAVAGIPVLAGRSLDVGDGAGAPLVLVVSESMARRDFPTESAIGKRIRFQRMWRTIVGVVADIKYKKLSSTDEPTVYVPAAQRDFGVAFLIRTSVDPTTLVTAVRAAVREVEPRATVSTADVMSDLLRKSFAEERYRTVLISIFGVLAGVLACVGMYGVTARSVAQRTREMGIRMALGATSGALVRLIVSYTVAGVLLGVMVGLAGAAGASRLLAPFLFGVSTLDPATYAGVLVLLALVSLVASWLPAQRASRVEVASVLRGE
jgi:putative ABC transport system permease protein